MEWSVGSFRKVESEEDHAVTPIVAEVSNSVVSGILSNPLLCDLDISNIQSSGDLFRGRT